MKGIDSTSAWAAWIALALLINLYWIGYDLWAWKTGHYTMTRQMQDWLAGPVSGPIVFAILTGIVAAFFYHMLVKAAT